MVRIGVFEGNGGDLRIGLPWQSLHDGDDWRHEPLRLTVVIEAPRQAIEAVLHKHEAVRQLIDNGWIHLMRLEQARMGGGVSRRQLAGLGRRLSRRNRAAAPIDRDD